MHSCCALFKSARREKKKLSKKVRFHSDLVLLPITFRKEGRKEVKKKGRKGGGRQGKKSKNPLKPHTLYYSIHSGLLKG